MKEKKKLIIKIKKENLVLTTVLLSLLLIIAIVFSATSDQLDASLGIGNTAPTLSNPIEPSDPATYQSGASYQFNITVNDENGHNDIDTVLFEWSSSNATVSTYRQINSTAREYYTTKTDIDVGTYNYKWYANDSAGAWGNVVSGSYTINKAKPILILSNNTASVNTSGLVGYWRLESFNSTNGTADYSGWGNDGVGKNFDTDPASTVDGRFGQGVEFDGSDDYVEITDDDSLTLSNALSITLWIKPNVVHTGSWDHLVIKWDDSPSTMHEYHFALRNGNLSLYLNNGTESEAVIGSTTIPENVWSFVGVTWDGSTATAYYNGDVDGTGTKTGTISNTGAGLGVGRKNNGAAYPFNGTIDEVRIWNRSLTADEIKELYESRVTYPTATTFTGSESNTGDSDVTYNFYRNLTDVKSSENGTAITLGAGYHYYLFNTSGGQNYTRSAILLPLNITKTTPTITLTLNGTAGDKTYTYPQAIGASASESNSGDSDVTYTLWRDGVSKGTGSSVSENIRLGNATYVYKYNSTTGQNWTSTSLSRTAYVNKGYLDLSISASPSWSEIYPTETNVTGTESNTGDSDVTYQLWRNTTMVDNTDPWEDVQTLDVGTHLYRFNATSGANWTANLTGVSNTLTINDTADPQWRNLGTNSTDNTTQVGYGINLTAQGYDDFALDFAILSTNETGEWKNYTDNTYGSPMDMGDAHVTWTWSNFTWTNSSFTSNTTISWRIYYNDTSGNENVTDIHNFTVYVPYLEVELVTPPSTLSVTQNQSFTINTTVYCRGGICGNVNGTPKYNASSANPDTSISTTTGDSPFFVNETSPLSMKACPTNPLSQNEYCNLTWVINATGAQNSEWKVGVLFNTTQANVADNHTTNSTITITPCYVDLDVSWSSISFGTVNPSSNQNAAPGNANKDYNITVKQGSCITNLWIKGTDLENTTLGYTIGVGNLTWGNTTNDYSSSYNMTTGYESVEKSVGELTNVTTYYWLNVPAVAAGKYNGTVTIFGNETS